MDGTSLTPEQEKINALRQILPEAFSEGKIDWEKLQATLGEGNELALILEKVSQELITEVMSEYPKKKSLH